MIDILGFHSAAHRTIMPTVNHLNHVYANNRAEALREPTQAQRFLTLHGMTQKLVGVGRHLLQAVYYRLLHARVFRVWREVACE